jgi:hypothetical protein
VIASLPVVADLSLSQEMKSANDKRDVLATHIADLAGDMSATVLHMKAINCSDLAGRLRGDLDKYFALSLRSFAHSWTLML